jgi:hypothetical protein
MRYGAPRWLTAGLRLLPPGRRGLGAGLLAEAGSVPPGRERWAWLASGAWYMAREIVKYRCAYWLALAAAAGAVGVLNGIGTSDDASQVVMAALLSAAAGLGWAMPRRAWLAGIVLGSVLPVTGMVQAALGVAGPVLPTPGGIAGAATLFVLLIPALAGASLGAGSHRLLTRAR